MNFKKLLILSLSFSIIFGGLFSGINFAKADNSTNLITNPDVEIANAAGTAPQNWQIDSWGTNSPSFTYKTDTTGNKSLLVQMSAYSSGDAKWYFNPVTVLPNTQYLYSDYYRATVSTNIVAQITDTSGNVSYPYMGSDPASSTMIKNGFILTTPANAAFVTIFHLINKNGSLETDNFSLTTYRPALTLDAVPNGSLEQVSDLNSSLPAYWQTNSWGTNAATFSYLQTGHTGERSVEVTMSSYTSGDAKWYYTPQPVTGGKNFELKDYYRSNVSTIMMLMVNKTDGTTQYIFLGVVPASTSWSLFSYDFIMPVDAQTASIFHIINTKGYLITDDYSLTPYTPHYFSRPIVSFTFDDGYDSYATTVLPLLSQYNYKSTAYIITSEVGDTEAGYMTLSQVKAAYAAGNEIGSHTVTHPHLDTLSARRLTNELVNSKNYLQTNVGPVYDFAAPYGEANANTILQIQKYYSSNRSVDVGYNTPDNFDPYHLLVQNMEATTTLAEFQSWIDYAQQNNCWLIIVYHQVDNSGDLYSTTPTNFASQLSYINQNNLTVETIHQALGEVQGQIK